MSSFPYYILDSKGDPVPVTLLEWAKWLDSDLGKSRLLWSDAFGKIRVSTVFLGMDHRLHSLGLPILWETMVFGICNDDGDVYQERYTSKEAAQKGHQDAVEWTKKFMGDK